jgi:hypothetical protein
LVLFFKKEHSFLLSSHPPHLERTAKAQYDCLMLKTSKPVQRRTFLVGAGAALAACEGPGGYGAGDADASPRVPAQPRDQRAELLRVGPGQEYPTLTLAGCRLQQKWTDQTGKPVVNPEPAHLIISPGPPGYYVNDSGSHSRRWPAMVGWPPYEGNLFGPAIIEGEPGKPAPDLVTDGAGDGVLYYQAGLFITTGYDTIFRNLHFAGFRRSDGQGIYAGVRLNPQEGRRAQVVFEDVEIDHCDNGIMGGDPRLNLVLRRCYFHDNGNGTGRCHNVYLSDGESLLAEDVLSTTCTIGHLMKSRAAKTTIRNCRLLGLGGLESACLDVPDAGVLDIDGLVCEKSPGTDANWLIHYSGENQDAARVPFHVPSSIKIRNLVMIAPPAMERHREWGEILGFVNQSGLGDERSGQGSYLVEPDAAAVQVFGLTAKTAGLAGVTVLQTRPALDTRPPTSA